MCKLNESVTQAHLADMKWPLKLFTTDAEEYPLEWYGYMVTWYAIPSGARHAVRFLVLFTLFNVLVCTAAHPCRVDLDSNNTVNEHITYTFRPHGTMYN